MLWLQSDHSFEKVKLYLVDMLFDQTPILGYTFHVQLYEGFSNLLVLYFCAVNSQNGDYLAELVDFGVPLEQSCSRLHEVKYATQGPQIDLAGVPFLPVKQFRSPVVETSDLICHVLGLPDLLLGHPEIDEFEGVEGGADLHGLDLRGPSAIFAGEHDVCRFDISVKKAVGVHIVQGLQGLNEKLLDGVLFLAFDDLLQCQAAPLHHDYRRLFARVDVQDLRDELTRKSAQNVVLPHKARREADSAGSLESLDSHDLLSLLMKSLVDLAIGTLCYSFEQRILVDQSIALHDYQLSTSIILSIIATTLDQVMDINLADVKDGYLCCKEFTAKVEEFYQMG